MTEHEPFGPMVPPRPNAGANIQWAKPAGYSHTSSPALQAIISGRNAS